MAAGSSKSICCVDDIDDIWMPEVISLGPGGEKGYIELGVLHSLYVQGFLSQVHTYIGCSVGAAIALLMSSGYAPSTIINQTMMIEIFKDLDSIDIRTMKSDGGVLSNSLLRNFLEQLLVLQFGYIPTFEQLYSQTNITLTIVSHNLNKAMAVYFSHRSHPNMSVVDAVALSANIPGVFKRIQYEGDYYIDGAFADPHPINYHDDGRTRILGLYITTPHTEPETSNKTSNDSFDVMNYLIRSFYSSITVLRREKQLRATKACRQLRLFVRDDIQFSVPNKPKLVCDGILIGNDFIRKLIHEMWNS